MLNVDTFIERAEEICEKSKKAPALTQKAQREGRALLKQFEKYLRAKGLGAPTGAERELKAHHYSRQHRSTA